MKLTHYIILIPFSFLTSFSRSTMNVVAKKNTQRRAATNWPHVTDAFVLNSTHETSMWDNAQG